MTRLKFTYPLFTLAVAAVGLLFITDQGSAADPVGPAIDRISHLPPEIQKMIEEQVQAQAQVLACASFGQNCNNPNIAPPCNEDVFSLGGFRIRVFAGKFINYFNGCPLWQSQVCPAPYAQFTTGRLASPLLVDQNTIIGKSDDGTHGDALDLGPGRVVGSPPTLTVMDSDFTSVPASFQGPVGTPEIHTELRSLCLTPNGNCTPGQIRVMAGRDLGISPNSVGEVESLDIAAPDCPGESFFDVFVNVEIPMCGGMGGNMVLENINPLLVKANPVDSLPPNVVYLHGETDAINVYTANAVAGPNGWAAGELVGTLVLAGHSVSGGGKGGPDPFAAACPVGEREPGVPAVSEWGVAALTLLLLTAATVVMKRRTAAA